MARLSNIGVMTSLLCALLPNLAACGGGDAGSSNPGTADQNMEDASGSSAGGASPAGKGSSTAGKSSAAADGGAADTGTPTAVAGAGTVAGEGDLEAPSVVSTLPLEGASGVKSDAAITLAFSEPMDKATVESSYESGDLPAAAVTFTWNDASTQLTITPNDKLEYASGKDPADVLAKGYVVSIGASAADLAANPMAEEVTLTFTTLREISANLAADADLSGHVDLKLKAGSATIQAGDTLGNQGDRGLLSFDLSSVPAVYQVLSAQVVARQGATTNKPFVDLSANASSAKLTLFDTKFATRAEGAGLLPGSSIGPFSTSDEAGERVLTVTGNVEKDLASRAALGNLTQYSLQFPVLSDGGTDVDKVQFAAAALKLSYYTP